MGRWQGGGASVRWLSVPVRLARRGRGLVEAIAARAARLPLAVVVRGARRESSGLAELNERELAVLGEMAQGRTNPAIAESLHLSVSAIEKHINAIFFKLNLTHEQQVHRRVAAVITYLRDGDRGA